MHKILKEKFPYLTSFLETGLTSQKKSISHSIIFYGMDVLAQYHLAVEIARLLNCKQESDDACDCQNCKWIKENKHPAVITISKIDNKSDSAKTVISKEQIDNVLDKLASTSDYHRVFIFCDADFKELSEIEKKQRDEFTPLNFCLPESPSENLFWTPKGLTRLTLQDVAANSLLKSIEEPPSNVTFVFLTEDKNDLIQTIISRSQAFYVPSYSKTVYDTGFLADYLGEYPEFDKDSALKFSKHLYNYQIESGLSLKDVLDSIQYYLKELLKANTENKTLSHKIYGDINKIQELKQMSDAYIKDQFVYETLALYFAGLVH